MSRFSQKGFSPIIILVIVMIIVTSVGGFFVYQKFQAELKDVETESAATSSSSTFLKPTPTPFLVQEATRSGVTKLTTPFPKASQSTQATPLPTASTNSTFVDDGDIPAKGDVVLTVSPTQVSAKTGNTFSADISMDTKSEKVTGVELHLKYDPQKLQLVTFQTGTFLPVVLVPAAYGSGSASITLGTSPTAPQTGTGILVSISFKALSATSGTSISFDSTTNVAAIGQTDNAVGLLISSNVAITD